VPYKNPLTKKEHDKKYYKKYYLKNRDIILKNHKKRNSTIEYKEKKKEYDKLYWKANRKRLISLKIKKNKIRRREDPVFRLKENLRRRMNCALNSIGVKRTKRSLELLGVPNIEFLKNYLESKFKPGMSWEKRGLIHIDHIIPCVAFDLTDPKQQLKCFHYTNLQPLWAHENLSKNSKILKSNN
jgi:hypothetical protein